MSVADSDPPDPHGWDGYRRQILDTIDRLERASTMQSAQLAKLDKDLAVLSTRVMLYSAAIAAAVGIAVDVLVRLVGGR